MIFLSAKHWEISDHSVFMFHDYSSWSIGKGGEMFDELTHFRKWSEHLWKDAYGEFLTEDEIQDILSNKDIWMDAQEVADRLNQMAEKREEHKTLNNIEKPAPKKKAAPKKTTRTRKKTTTKTT